MPSYLYIEDCSRMLVLQEEREELDQDFWQPSS